MDPTQRFAELVRGPEETLALDEACLLVAAHARPGLDPAAQLARLDDLASRVTAPTVDALVDLLFTREGFRGNTDDYYHPDNSFLEQVLDRRVGIPITLSVLAIEVGRRAGVLLDGVGMPGHFLVRTRGEPTVYLDPFAAGRRLDVDGCAELFRRSQGGRVPFDETLLAPVGPRAILARLLANLRANYAQQGDRQALVWVLRLRCSIPGVPLAERRDLASALAADGRFGEAARELERLAEQVDDPSAEKLRVRAGQLRAQLN
jgi:regulator of sirC expression with transglutaminase-like and TPR domain